MTDNDGEIAAVGEVCMRYRTAAIKAVRADGGTIHEAEDAADRAALIYLERVQSGRGPAIRNPEAWFITTSITGFRSGRTRAASRDAKLLESIGWPQPVVHDPEQVVVLRDEVERTAAAVRRLPPRQRTLLFRRAIDGASSAELAYEFGISAVNVRKELQRGRARVRAEVGRSANVLAAFWTSLTRRVPAVPEAAAALVLVIGGIGGQQTVLVPPRPPAATAAAAPAAPAPRSPARPRAVPAEQPSTSDGSQHRVSPTTVASRAPVRPDEWAGEAFGTYKSTCGDPEWHGGTPESGKMECEVSGTATECAADGAPSERGPCSVTIDRVPLAVRLTRVTASAPPTCLLDQFPILAPGPVRRRFVSTPAIAPAASYVGGITASNAGTGSVQVAVLLRHLDQRRDGAYIAVAEVTATFSVTLPCALTSAPLPLMASMWWGPLPV